MGGAQGPGKRSLIDAAGVGGRGKTTCCLCSLLSDTSTKKFYQYPQPAVQGPVLFSASQFYIPTASGQHLPSHGQRLSEKLRLQFAPTFSQACPRRQGVSRVVTLYAVNLFGSLVKSTSSQNVFKGVKEYRFYKRNQLPLTLQCVSIA